MGKFYEAIMGLVVGDALGVPFEFRRRDTFKAEGMIGFGTHNQPPGTWSDDSSMTLATVESLARLKRVNPYDIMKNFCQWYNNGAFTPHGKVFDVGGTTRKAISRFCVGWNPECCGGCSDFDNGNGALMRILPMAFVPGVTYEDVFSVSGLTHAHITSKSACWHYVVMAQALLEGCDKETIKRIFRIADLSHPFDRLKQLDSLTRDEIRSSGYVVDTLEAALWCFLKADSYRECVLMAVNLGEDTDTVAAVAGGLAGIYYGIGGDRGIPEEWIDQIVKKDMIKDLCDRFEETFMKGN